MKSFLTFLVLTLVLFPLLGKAGSSVPLDLRGKIAPLYDLKLTALQVSTGLSILKGNKGTLVARSTETCNAREGYDVLVSSLNASELRHEANPSLKTSYTLRYSSGAYVKLSTTPQVMYSVASLKKKTIKNQNIWLNVNALPNAVAGAYSDTVVFTIQAR